MRVKTKSPLPRIWTTHPAAEGVILETDISPGHGSLKAKLLVFKDRKSLRKFWKGISHGSLGVTCQGAVNGLYREVIQIQPRGSKKPDTVHLEVDPRYFCVIGLVRGFLSMEIISHEAVHAGFAFAKRISGAPWSARAQDFDEEAVAYPSGRIAAAINRALYAAKLYK
jgi:hypothetical protein